MGNRILFTNVKYEVGGGKSGKPLRVRKHQNVHKYLQMPIEEITPDLLEILTEGKYVCTKLTTIKVRNR